MNSRRKSLFLFPGFAVIVSIIFVLFSEPRYESKTAWQWFKERLKGRVDEGQYAKAVLALHTNFHEVMVKIPRRFLVPANVRKKGLYAELGDWMRKEVFKSVTVYQYRDTLRETAGLLHQSPLALTELHRLKAALKKSIADDASLIHQGFLMQSIYAIATGDKDGALANSHLEHQDFLVRFQAAKLNRPDAQGLSPSDRLAIPVLVEAVTNKNLINECFGATERVWRLNANNRLRKLSPEVSTQYLDYLNQP